MSRAARRIGVEENADFETRRMIILREAARAYTSHGAEGISMNELARRLNVTKPALYHYLSGKDQIISECVAQAEERLGEIFAMAEREGRSGLEKLELIARAYCTLVTDDFGRFMVLLDLNTLKPSTRQGHLEMQADFRRRTEQLIEQCMREGSIAPGNPKVFCFALVGALNSLARWYKRDGALTLDEVARALFDTFIEGVRRREAC